MLLKTILNRIEKHSSSFTCKRGSRFDSDGHCLVPEPALARASARRRPLPYGPSTTRTPDESVVSPWRRSHRCLGS